MKSRFRTDVVKIITVVFVFAIALSFAQQVQDLVQDNSFVSKQKRVKSLLQKGDLSAGDKSALDNLWSRAQSIAQLNDRCAIISLNEVLDETCQKFYRIELPEFDKLYGQVTNDIRMNGISLMKNVDDERALVTACVDALYETDFHPSNFFKATTKFEIEPLMNGAELSYEVYLEANLRSPTYLWLRNSFNSFCKWNQYKNKPLVSQLASNYNERKMPLFRLEGLDMRPSRAFSFTYTINGKSVFSGKIEPNSPRGVFNFITWMPGYGFTASCPAMPHNRLHSEPCRGKIKLSEKDLANGYVGMLIWKEE